MGDFELMTLVSSMCTGFSHESLFASVVMTRALAEVLMGRPLCPQAGAVVQHILICGKNWNRIRVSNLNHCR